MHKLTQLLWKNEWRDKESVDKLITNYLSSRAEWLKKEYQIYNKYNAIDQAFELSVGEMREEYDFKKMEGKKNPHKVGEKCECKYRTTHSNTPGICYNCKKPIEPKPKLPEKIEHKSCDCVRLRLDEICADRIDKLIEYLRGRE